MKARFSSKGFPGFHLVAGLLVFVAMTLALGELSDDVMNGEPLTLVDAQLSVWLHAHASPHLTAALRMITSLHSTLAVSLAALVVGICLWLRRQRYWLATVWLSVFGGMLLNWLLKLAFQRARPRFSDPILTITGYSFPSGHTMMATVFYGVLAAYLISKTKTLGERMLVILSASILIALVGFSRIYLGAHYLSDVLGAMVEGLAWLSLCLAGVDSVWRRHGRRKKAG